MFNIDLSNFETWLLSTLLFILRYMLIAGSFFFVFYVWKKKKLRLFKLKPNVPSNLQIKREILYSILTLFIYGCGVWLFLFWTQNDMTREYKYFSTYGFIYFISSIVLMVIIHDTYFYWIHRFMHHSNIFKYVHKLHHTFVNPTPWAAFAFHPFEAILSIGVIPIIIFLIPYHQWALIIFVTILTINNICIHLGFSLPDFMSNRFQNTAIEHDIHHSGIDKNFGLYFNFWDKLMGTYQRR